MTQQPELMFDLMAKLPECGANWSDAERLAWFRAAAAVFDVVYKRPPDDDRQIVVKAEAVRQG